MSGTLRLFLRTNCALALAAFLPHIAAADSPQLRLIADAHDGRLDDFDFVTACLIAGGMEDECELGGWLQNYEERKAALLADIPAGRPLDRLAAIHRELHRRFLSGGYDVQASELRRVLSSGDYNCLSAAAVMFALCQAANLPLEIRLEQGHVSLQLRTPDQEPAVLEAGGGSLMSSGRPKTGTRMLTPIQFLGKFYYNRGVQRLKGDQFAEGLELLAISLQFDPDDAAARTNLVAGINNWAAAFCALGDYGQAAQLIEVGLRLDAGFAPLVANQQLVRAKLGQR